MSQVFAPRSEGTSRRLVAGLVLVFILALLPRLFYPSSRYLLWYDRSVHFWDALMAGDFADTYQQHHPGVTTMWIAGLGLRLYMTTHGWSSDTLLQPPSGLSGPQGGPAQAGTAALGLTIALCIVLAYVLLVRMINWPVAFCAGCLLALDPFYITHSKMIHVDGLLASFMLASALLLLAYVQKERWTYLFGSGIFAGLAFLTKSPGLFLAPYAVFVLALSLLISSDSAWDLSSLRVWRKQLWRISRSLIVWGFTAACIFFLLWPAMWSEPWNTVSKIAASVEHHVETPHPGVNFFAGRVTDHLGLLYYMASLAWKTTLVTLPAVCVAVLFLALRRSGSESGFLVSYVLAYAVGFLFMMTLGAKKWSRYILPTFVALDVVAAWGLVQATDIIGKQRWLRGRSWVPTALVTAALIAQAISVLRHHPYYGTHYNLLLGGSRVARHVLHLGDQGEGLDLAARFLNRRPGAERITAGVQDTENQMFRSNFVGRVEPIAHSDVDYRVFSVHYTQRNEGAYRWGDLREARDQTDELIWSASFDGVPYVWVSRAYPHDPQMFDIDHPLNVELGESIRLLGYSLSSSEPTSGDPLTVTLFWQSTSELSADYHVFVHLQNEDGSLVAQHDGVPLYGERPTWSWQEAEVLQDEHRLLLDDALPDGRYTLSVGMYDYPSGIRLPAVEPGGRRLRENRIVLDEVEVASSG
jgi:hypothetical protein